MPDALGLLIGVGLWFVLERFVIKYYRTKGRIEALDRALYHIGHVRSDTEGAAYVACNLIADKIHAEYKTAGMDKWPNTKN